MKRCFIVLAILIAVATLVATTDLPPPAAEVSQNYSLYHFDVLHGAPGATSVMVAMTVELNPDTTPTELSAIVTAANGAFYSSNCVPAFYWYKGDRPATSRIAKMPTLKPVVYGDDFALEPEVVDLRRQNTALLL